MTGKTKAMAGSLIWVAQAALLGPSVRDNSWTYLLIAFAALVLLPLLLDVVLAEDRTRLAGWVLNLQLPAAVLLAVSLLLPPGGAAAFAALPWVGFTCLLAVVGLTATMLRRGRRSLGRICEDVALIFASIGGLWLLADRIGLRPLNFDPAIVALTAAHFHYAGILLTAYTGFLLDRYPESRLASRAAVGVVLGIPAVAAGITATQFGWGPSFEIAAGLGLAVAGMAIAILHVRMATENAGPPAARVLAGIAGGSLFFGMFLAGIYALRSSALPVPQFDLASMRLLHGTVTAMGFGLCGVLGWRMVLRREPGR